MLQSTKKLVAIVRRFSIPAAVAGAFVLGASLFVGHGAVHAASPLDDNSVSALTALDHAMETVAARVTPAVVNVSVTSKVSGDVPTGDHMQNLPPGFQQFFGPMPQQPQQPQYEHGVGSGIIISPDGYIVTNNHVADGATDIKVTLHDRRILNAKVVGVDKLNDLAVLKVDAKNLPTIAWGDSNRLEPGQTVLAFGSPFGYFQFSVTRGIVSAVHRRNPYSDDPRKPGNYIQTDAAINPGNSGGPLVDARGELVGINTFIISSGGSFAGAGFAIPSQIVKASAEQIIQHGKVEHGYLGISINDVTPANAHFFALQNASGAIVAQVTPDSPASRAGLLTGDVITGIDGQQVSSGNDLQVAVSEMAPGTKASFEIVRNGKPEKLDLTVGRYHGGTEVADNDNGDNSEGGKLGLAVSNLTPQARQQDNIPDHVRGVVVQNVRPASPADEAGIQPGDVIVELNRKPVESANQFASTVRQNKSGQDLLMLVWSRGNASYRTLRPNQGNQNG